METKHHFPLVAVHPEHIPVVVEEAHVTGHRPGAVAGEFPVLGLSGQVVGSRVVIYRWILKAFESHLADKMTKNIPGRFHLSSFFFSFR